MDFRLRFKRGKQRELLLTLKKELGLNQRELAAELSVKSRALQWWIYEAKTLPEAIFHKILQFQPKFDRFANAIEEVLPANWKMVKGGKSRYNQLLRTKMFAKHHEKMLANRRKMSKMEKVKLLSSSDFYKREVERKKLHPLPLLATLLLTDGYLQRRGVVGYTSRDWVLMNVFIDLVKANSEKVPNILRRNDGGLEVYIFDPKLTKKLFSLSPSYKKSPGKMVKEEYLQEPQPTADFLQEQDTKTKVCSIRLAMSADGCVTVHRARNGRLDVRLMLSCANPTLVRGWKDVFETLCIKATVKKGSKWSGIEGLMISRKEALRIFQRLGGFVDGVRVSRKSPNFAGIEKNVLLNWAIKNY